MPVDKPTPPELDPLQVNVNRIGECLDQLIELGLSNGTSADDVELAKTCQVVVELDLLLGNSDPEF